MSGIARLNRVLKRLIFTVVNAPGFSNRFKALIVLLEHIAGKIGKPLSSKVYDLKLEDMNIRLQASSQELLGYWEIFLEKEYQYFDQELNENSVICDIGANIGFFALFYARRKKAGKIFSFEPSPSVYKQLEHNIHANGKGVIKIFPKALGDNKGVVAFEQAPLSLNSKIVPQPTESSTNVEVSTLDDCVMEEDIAMIDLLKIDTEGFELQVLKGGISRALPRTQRMIIEFHKTEDRDAIIALAKKAGLQCVLQKHLLLFFSRKKNHE